MAQPLLIGVDWGSSNFRAYLCGEHAKPLAHKFSPHGIFKLQQGKLASFLQQELKDWLVRYPQLPIIACGMVGSAGGWHVAPYLDCPALLADLAKILVTPKSAMQRQIRIVPGVQQISQQAESGDVMRGEETQILGAVLSTADDASTDDELLAARLQQGTTKQLVCLPGTHSKWACVAGGTIKHFRTFMTGELFALLLQSKSLVKLLAPVGHQNKTDWPAFYRGLEAARQQHGMLADIFNIRAQLLQDNLRPQDIRHYLSGLLIGHEILQASSYTDLQVPIILVAAGELAERYKKALAKFKLQVKVVKTEEVTRRGLFYLASVGGLLKN